MIVKGNGCLDWGLPTRKIVAGQQPAMAPPRRIQHALVPAETVDGLGDKAAIPGGAGALDLVLARPAAGFCQDAAVSRRKCRIAEQPPRLWRHAARQVDRGRTRPFAAE